MKPAILILGAGIYQAPLIRKARERGCEALVASIPGDFPGIALADQFYAVDIREVGNILALAQASHAAAILTTGADAGLPAIGAVVDTLGLRGPSRKIAETVSSKSAFRAFLQAHGHPHPPFVCCPDGTEAWRFYSSLKRKCVFKPDDASGSRGVTILEPGLPAERVAAAYEHARLHARNGLVCAEAFITGRETGGDAFFFDGAPVFFTTTDKHMQGVMVRGHSLPNPRAAAVEPIVGEAIGRIAADLGYDAGPMNFDAIIAGDSVYLLEIGLRNGGNGIVDLIYHGMGVDLLEMALDHALGEPLRTGWNGVQRPVSSYVFGSGRPGRLRSIASLHALREMVPAVFDVVMARKPGEEVGAFTHNANLLGYLLLDGGSAEYEILIAELEKHLHIEIEP